MEILSPKQLMCGSRILEVYPLFLPQPIFLLLFHWNESRRPPYPHIVADPVSLAHLEENIIVNEGKVAILNGTAHENVAAGQGSLAKEKGERVKAEESLRDSSFEAGVQIYTRVAKS